MQISLCCPSKIVIYLLAGLQKRNQKSISDWNWIEKYASFRTRGGRSTGGHLQCNLFLHIPTLVIPSQPISRRSHWNIHAIIILATPEWNNQKVWAGLCNDYVDIPTGSVKNSHLFVVLSSAWRNLFGLIIAQMDCPCTGRPAVYSLPSNLKWKLLANLHHCWKLFDR